MSTMIQRKVRGHVSIFRVVAWNKIISIWNDINSMKHNEVESYNKNVVIIGSGNELSHSYC